MADKKTVEEKNASQYKLVRWFRQATPYINEYRGKTFVVMLGGDAVESAGLRNIIHDIALLNSLGVRIVIVHGVRKQLEAKLAAENVKSKFVHNLRVTDQVVLEAAIQACSLVRAQLETRLSMGLPNSPMHGAKVRVASGNVITAKPAGVIDGIDLLQTGLVRKFDCEAINTYLDLGNVVLLSPLGYSPAGEAFSLAYDHVASELAAALGAEKLLAFCQPHKALSSDGELMREISLQQAQQLLEQSGGPAAPGYLQAAVRAVSAGVPRAHLLDFERDGALLQELFTIDGAGTLISQHNFETMRSADAEDVPAIIDLITPLEDSGVLVRRDRSQLANEIEQFTVIEREGLLIALAALYPYSGSNSNQPATGEIACITTHPDYRNRARASQLLQQLQASARSQGIQRLFVLTTQTTHWFMEQGFILGSVADLPAQKQSLYNYQRNSKVLIKNI